MTAVQPDRPEPRWSGLALALAGLVAGCESSSSAGTGAPPPAIREVVVYTSVDEDLARPVLARFSEAHPQIRVAPVFDVEATKTTGLVSRILAERAEARADVFWSSEPLRTEHLKREGALEAYRPATAADLPAEWKDPDGCWTAFAARARVLAWNTKRLAAGEAPARLDDLLAPRFKGEVAIANPLFGTAGTEAAYLHASLGAGRARAFYAALAANGARVVDGNSVVRDLVTSGAVLCGLTDTDDAFSAIDAGKPLAFRYAGLGDDATVLIPNTVALVKGAPHAEAGRALVDFLASAEAERLLAALPGRQMPLRPALAPLAAPPAKPAPEIARRRVTIAEAFAALAPSQAMLREVLGK